MFDALIAVAEALWGLLEAILFFADIAVTVADVFAWFKGRENRTTRRLARKSGQPPPPRDRWNRRVIWLSLIAAALTVGLLVWRLTLRR